MHVSPRSFLALKVRSFHSRLINSVALYCALLAVIARLLRVKSVLSAVVASVTRELPEHERPRLERCETSDF